MDIWRHLYKSGVGNNLVHYIPDSLCARFLKPIYILHLDKNSQDIKPSGKLFKKTDTSHRLAGKSVTCPSDIRKTGCVFFPPAGNHVLFRGSQPLAQSGL